jgi:hypothetical protein
MMTQRPILTVPQNPQTLFLDWFTLVGLAALWAIAIHAWVNLPEYIPIHFGNDGRPDRWGDKGWIWLLPSLGTLQVLFLTVLRRFPHTFNYLVPITEENAAYQYAIACSLLNWLKAQLVWFFAYIEWQMVQGSIRSIRLGAWFLPLFLLILPLFLLVVFATIGYWLRKALVS